MRLEINNQNFGIKKTLSFNDTLKRRTQRASFKDYRQFRQHIFKLNAEKEKSEAMNRQKKAEMVITKLKSIIENKNKQ